MNHNTVVDETTMKNEQQEERNKKKINELRVAQAELTSGNTEGKVFVRLSSGAVGFRIERQEAQERVTKELRKTLLEEDKI